jgi:hypothetical protein
MKFIVREGFVVHDTKIVEINGQNQEQTNSYYEGQAVDFNEASALDHAHKLVPSDKSAQAFFDKNFPPIAEVQAQAGGVGDASGQIAALAKQVSDLTALISVMVNASAGNPQA